MSLLMVRKSAPAKAAQDYDPRYANPQAEEKFKAKIREYGKAHGGSLKGITSGDVIKWAKEIGCENYVVPWQDAIGYFRYGKGKGEFATDGAAGASLKVGDLVKVDPHYSANANNGVGKVSKILLDGAIEVDFGANGKVRVPQHYYKALDSAAGAKDSQDANGDEVIVQKNGCKLVHNTLNDGYWFYTKSGAGWGLTATNKVAAINEFNRLVNSAKDAAADADKSEELEREIKGDAVAVVSGNAARVSKDVSFATAKEGVESFARKNGVSVVSSQEYGEAYKFKFSAAIDSCGGVAQDRGDYTSNIEALLKMAYSNLNKAHGVMGVVLKNFSDAIHKVKDEQTKAFLKDREHEWWLCERELSPVIDELEKIAVPSHYGIPHKVPSEERKLIAQFFGW